MSQSTIFSVNLQQQLERRGWRPTRFAAELEDHTGELVYPATVGRWLDGTSSPRLETARHIADVLDVSLDSLLPKAIA